MYERMQVCHALYYWVEYYTEMFTFIIVYNDCDYIEIQNVILYMSFHG